MPGTQANVTKSFEINGVDARDYGVELIGVDGRGLPVEVMVREFRFPDEGGSPRQYGDLPGVPIHRLTGYVVGDDAPDCRIKYGQFLMAAGFLVDIEQQLVIRDVKSQMHRLVYFDEPHKTYHALYHGGHTRRELKAEQWKLGRFLFFTVEFRIPDVWAYGDEVKRTLTLSATSRFILLPTGTAPSRPRLLFRNNTTAPITTLDIVGGRFAFNCGFDEMDSGGYPKARGIKNNQAFAGDFGTIYYAGGKLSQGIALAGGEIQADTFWYYNMADQSTPTGAIADGINANQGTVSFWAKASKAWNDGRKWYFYDTGNSGLHIIKDTDNYLKVYDAASGNASTLDVSAWLPGTWYLIIAWWDTNGASTKLQIFGGSTSLTSGSAQTSYTATTPGQKAYIGSDINGRYPCFSVIDDFRIADIPLSSTDRTALLNSGTGTTNILQTPLVYFPLDGTAGSAVPSGANTRLGGRYAPSLAVSATTLTAATVAAGGGVVFRNGDRFIIIDETGYKAEGTVSGTPTATSIPYASLTGADKIGVSAGFDGASRFERTTTADLDVTTEDFIISAWVKSSNRSNQQNPVQKSMGVSNAGYYIYMTNASGQFGGYMRDAATNTLNHNSGVNTATDGKWHHILWAVDRSSATGSKLYIDGVQVGSDGNPTAVGSLTNSERLKIGFLPSVGYIGNIKGLRIWIAADLFTGETVATKARTLASNPLGASVSWNGNAEKGWWHFTDASFASQAADSSGNAYHLDGIVGTPARNQVASISRNLLADAGMENGGLGGWSDGVAGTLIAKSTTAIRRDTRSLRVTNVDASQAWAAQTIKSASGEDYVARGWLYGPTTVNGESQVMRTNFSNVLTNPGFETGATSPWVIYGTNTIAIESTTVKHGTYSVKVTYQDDLRLISSEGLTLAANVTYVVRVWAYVPTAFDGSAITLTDDGTFVGATKTGGSVNLGLRDQWQEVILKITLATDTGGSFLFRITGAPTAGRFIFVDSAVVTRASITATQAGIAAGTWGHVETCFEASGASCEMHFGSGSITNAELGYWDAISVQQNLIDNGGLEGGAGNPYLPTGWSNSGLASGESDNGGAVEHSGSDCIRINAAAGSRGIQQTFGATASQWYEVSCWLRVVSGTAQVVVDSNVLSNLVVLNVTNAQTGSNFVRFSTVFKVPDTSTATVIYFRSSGGAAEFYVDDVAIVHRPDLDATLTPLGAGAHYVPTRRGKGFWTAADVVYFGAVGNPAGWACVWRGRPQFGYDIAEDVTLLEHYFDANNSFRLWYDSTNDKFSFRKRAGGTNYEATTRVVGFIADQEVSLICSFDNVSGSQIYYNGSAAGSTPNTNATALSTGTTTERGTAQAGAALSVTLASGASASDDYYNGWVIESAAGTGAGQHRRIADYTGATKVAAINNAWTTTPDNTSKYLLYSSPVAVGGTVSATQLANAIHDEVAIFTRKITAREAAGIHARNEPLHNHNGAIQLTPTIAAGDFVEVDCDDLDIQHFDADGVSDSSLLADGIVTNNSRFFQLHPAEVSTDGDIIWCENTSGELDVRYSQRWI